MKSILSITFLSIMLLSCGNKENSTSLESILSSGETEQINAKRIDLVAQQQVFGSANKANRHKTFRIKP